MLSSCDSGRKGAGALEHSHGVQTVHSIGIWERGGAIMTGKVDV